MPVVVRVRVARMNQFTPSADPSSSTTPPVTPVLPRTYSVL